MTARGFYHVTKYVSSLCDLNQDRLVYSLP